MNVTDCDCESQLLVDVTAQFSHALGGAFFVVAVGVIFGKCSTLYAFVLVAAGAAIKEFYWDYNFESPTDRGSDLEDFSFYMLGAFVGFLVNLFLPGTLDPRVLCFCAPRYQRIDGTPEKQNYGLCLWRQPES